MAGIAGFKVKQFQDANDLAAFVVANVTTVYSITLTGSCYTLFYA